MISTLGPESPLLKGASQRCLAIQSQYASVLDRSQQWFTHSTDEGVHVANAYLVSLLFEFEERELPQLFLQEALNQIGRELAKDVIIADIGDVWVRSILVCAYLRATRELNAPAALEMINSAYKHVCLAYETMTEHYSGVSTAKGTKSTGAAIAYTTYWLFSAFDLLLSAVSDIGDLFSSPIRKPRLAEASAAVEYIAAVAEGQIQRQVTMLHASPGASVDIVAMIHWCAIARARRTTREARAAIRHAILLLSSNSSLASIYDGWLVLGKAGKEVAVSPVSEVFGRLCGILAR